MLKKILFIILVFSFMIAGSLVCMAYGDDDFVESSYLVTESTDFLDLVAPAVSIENIVLQEEGYSDEAVIEKYSSLFFDTEDETEIELIRDIVVNEFHNYALSAIIAEGVQIDEGDNIVVMAFVQKDDSFELIASEEVNRLYMCLEPVELNLPHVGKDNPNYVRIIAFRKNSYDNLSLANIQIHCKTIVIDNKKFDFESTIHKGPLDTIKHVNSKIGE